MADTSLKSFWGLEKGCVYGLQDLKPIHKKRLPCNACVLPVLLHGTDSQNALFITGALLGISNRQQWLKCGASTEVRRRWVVSLHMKLITERIRKKIKD